MTKYFNIKTLALATAMATTMFSAQAFAQNVVTVPATATVQNAITMTQNTPMAFATLVAINDGTEQATATLAPDSSISFATSGPPAIMQQANGTPTAADISLAGVNGSTINLTLSNVVSPTDGTDTLTLNNFQYTVNGSVAAGLTPGVAVSYTATASDTLLIGADLVTPAQPAQIADGAYTGSFDITASY